MRPRTHVAALLVAPLLLLAACGGDDSSTDASAPATDAPASSDPGGDTTAPDATDTSTDPTPPTTPDKPEVSFPGTQVTEFRRTELTAGSGREAEAGDRVVVDYVGVRSIDGVEFDNSYDTGQPFSLTVGQGQVIQGWDEGLIGVQAGGRYQLDIPADQAYGDTGASDVIRPGDAISFVVDVRAVVAPVLAEDAPTDVVIEGQGNVDALEVEDLRDGEGPTAELGDTVLLALIAYRADTGEMLDNTWEYGEPVPLPLMEGAVMLSGMVEGLIGTQVGTQRLIRIPYEQAFGADGNPDLLLPAETDLVLLVDVLAIY